MEYAVAKSLQTGSGIKPKLPKEDSKIGELFIRTACVTRVISIPDINHVKKLNMLIDLVKAFTMKQINEQLEIVEFDHKLWLMELMAMRGEIDLYIDRIGRLIESTKDEDELRELADLRDGMTQEKQVTGTLLEDIKAHDARIKQGIHADGEVNALTGHSHGGTRKAMGIARVDFADLQEKFHLYSAGEG